MKNKILKIFLTCAALLSVNVSYAASECNQSLGQYGWPQSSKQLVSVCHSGYAVGYNSQTKTPAWVIENITRESLSITDGKKAERDESFQPDPTIPLSISATTQDYYRSGYDRGHMAPAADFAASQDQMHESFYFTNMVPQNSNLNRGAWSKLEANIRYWAKQYNGVYVVTGPIYYKGQALGKAGTVFVPTHIFKAIYAPSQNQAIAFIVPNQPTDWSDMSKYITTVGNLEKVAGINIFPKVSQQVKDSQVDWRLNKK